MATFHEMLRGVLDPEAEPGVFVAPDLPEKKLKGVAAYAAYGGETPLVVIDNTTFGSAKAGALVTSHALYVSTTKVRVPLETITTPPTFDDLDGWLATPDGTIKIPKMIMHEAQDAWERVFQVILSVNLGLAAGASAGAAPATPLDALAATTLRGRRVDAAGRLPQSKLRNASMTFPDWCDWLTGERIVGYVDETAMGKGDDGVLLTDRRLISHISGKDLIVHYRGVRGATLRKALLAQELRIATEAGEESLTLAAAVDAAPPLQRFLEGLVQIPPAARVSPSPRGGADDDPSGLRALRGSLPTADRRLLVLLDLLEARSAAGALTLELATDFVRRLEVLGSTIAFGRGAHEGWKLSPLPGEDLVAGLEALLGPPVGGGGDGMARFFDFSMERRGSLGRAAVSSAIGIAAFAIIGVGWVSTPGRTVSAVRLVVAPFGAATGFTLSARGPSGGLAPLAEVDRALAAQVGTVLEGCEALGLLVRLLWGWSHPAGTILAQPAEVMQREASSVSPRADLGCFFAQGG